MKIYILIALLLCIACNKTTSSGEFKNIKDKKWFLDVSSKCKEDAVCTLQINSALYNNNTVYYNYYTGPLCDTFFHISLLNKNGDTLKSYGNSNNINVFHEEVSNIKTIYTCD